MTQLDALPEHFCQAVSFTNLLIQKQPNRRLGACCQRNRQVHLPTYLRCQVHLRKYLRRQVHVQTLLRRLLTFWSRLLHITPQQTILLATGNPFLSLQASPLITLLHCTRYNCCRFSFRMYPKKTTLSRTAATSLYNQCKKFHRPSRHLLTNRKATTTLLLLQGL